MPQQLGLDFAPAQVRLHGLRDAHTYPQVARYRGESFRVPASKAWVYPSLELRAGNSWPVAGFDCDVPEKVLDALVSNHLGRPRPDAPRLPQPTVIVQRVSNSHSHVTYFLAKPVHRGETAREAPLRLLARIMEFYRQALGADAGYNGVMTHNPMLSAHRVGEFQTHWGRKQPYSLGELAEPIPKGWRLPVKPTTEAGRNCALFMALMKWAGSPKNIELEVLAVARVTNDGLLDVPLEIAKWPDSLRVSSATAPAGLPRAVSTLRPSAKRGGALWACEAPLCVVRPTPTETYASSRPGP